MKMKNLILTGSFFLSLSSFSQKDSLAYMYDTLTTEQGAQYTSEGYTFGNQRIGKWVDILIDSKEKWVTYYSDSLNKTTYAYDMNENLKYVHNYVLHPPDSIWRLEEGIVLNFENGSLAYHYFYQNGERNGLQISYFKDGTIKKIKRWESDALNGIYIEYFKNGNKKLKGYYVDDYKSGQWSYYFENGQVESVGSYKVLLATEHNRTLYGITSWTGGGSFIVKEGKWTYFNENGEWVKKEFYRNNNIVETIVPN
jgi:antitoxin component YwqK of YwqJK toxin-antitoxin module